MRVLVIAAAGSLDAGADHVLAGAATFALAAVLLLLGPLRWRGAVHAVRDSALLVASLAGGTALGLCVAVPARVGVLALASSIVYVAIENALAPATRGRAVLAAAFGVVHGMWLTGGAHHRAAWVTGATCMTALAATIVVVLAYLSNDQLGGARYRRYAVPALSAVAGVYAIVWAL